MELKNLLILKFNNDIKRWEFAEDELNFSVENESILQDQIDIIIENIDTIMFRQHVPASLVTILENVYNKKYFDYTLVRYDDPFDNEQDSRWWLFDMKDYNSNQVDIKLKEL